MKKPIAKPTRRKSNVDSVDRNKGLAEGLRRALQETGWSERGLALAAGLTADRLRNVNRGRSAALKGDAVERIAEVLGTTPGVLTGAEAWPTGGLKSRPPRPSRKDAGHDGSPAEVARAAWKAAEAAVAAAHAAQAAADAARSAAETALRALPADAHELPEMRLSVEALCHHVEDLKRTVAKPTKKQMSQAELMDLRLTWELSTAFAVVRYARILQAGRAGRPWPTADVNVAGFDVAEVELSDGTKHNVFQRWNRVSADGMSYYLNDPRWDPIAEVYVWPTPEEQ